MINSMTGFGRASEMFGTREVSVELRCVNHRYFEFSSRVSRAYSFVEDRLKPYIQNVVSRGKLDVGVTIRETAGQTVQITPNVQVARGYAAALQTIADELGIKNDVGAVAISRFPDVFSVVTEQPDEAEIWSEVTQVLDKALAGFAAMRATEGDKMRTDVLSRVDSLENMLAVIEKSSTDTVSKYRERLFNRMKSVLEDKNIDESRILLEAALYADKSAVDEETVRLHSHFAQFRGIVNGGGAVGRKLDFLVQEMNREVNTIASKTDDINSTATLVDMKAEIEKIREQIQNIE